jgi:hypothetical protein
VASPGAAAEHTRRWLDEFVVGLNLCPFARPLLDDPALRITVCDDARPEALHHAFLRELDLLQSSPEDAIATSLLVFTAALADFEDYLAFLDEAQALLDTAGLSGLVQLASFHPDYLFGGERPDSASHFSNRAPWPTIHFIREDMLSRVLGDFPDPDKIPARNVATLEELGVKELEKRWEVLFGRDD